MRNLYLILAVIFISGVSRSQNSIKVTESSEKFNSGNQNALVVTVFESNKDAVEKGLKKLFKDWNGNVKSKDELFGDDCSMKKMGKNTFDAYGYCVQEEKNVKVVVAIDLGGAYMSSSQHSDQYKIIQEELYQFAVHQTKEAIGEVMKAEEEKLEKLEKQKKEIESKIEDNKEDIEDYKKKIEEAEKNIKEGESEKETKSKEIGEQTKVVEEVKKKQSAVK